MCAQINSNNRGIRNANPNALQGDVVAKKTTGPRKTGISSVNVDSQGTPAVDVALKMGLNLQVSAAGQSMIDSLPGGLRDQLATVVGAFSGVIQNNTAPLPKGATDGLQSRWGDFMDKVGREGLPMDVNALVQWVLRESYQETTKDLHFYAQKVKWFNAIKKEIRKEIDNANSHMAKYGAKAKPEQSITKYDGAVDIGTDFTGLDEKGNLPAVTKSGLAADDKINPVDTKERLSTYIKRLEEKLSSVGDDAQLANVDLQNMLQKQQQTMQMMSNISKMLHDTGMAIIRKIGG